MEENGQQQSRHITIAGTGMLIFVSLTSRSATTILTPVWLHSRNNHTQTNDSNATCDVRSSDNQIDAYTILFIVHFLAVVFFGIILLVTKVVCPYLITERETKYDKQQFALIGASDAVSSICFVYASSGCRTAPYLRSIAANFAIPVTFIIRFLVLRKRPTCKKTLCVLLILFAEFTALLPDIFPGLESERARKEERGMSGIPGLLWPLCLFFGFISLGLVSIIIEKIVKSSSPARRRWNDDDTDINIAYFLFWSYLFTFLTLVLLFWTDMIPGFGMTDGVFEFFNGFWFNIKCFLGYEGCRGIINVISGACVVLLLLNRVSNSYFLRYLEGANYLVIITSLQTPIVFIFFALFDENPIVWHPHAYLSIWLSVTAICIMVPAIYIYNTGAPEVVSHSDEQLVFIVDSEVQTDPDDSSNHDTDETCRLLYDTEPSAENVNFVREDTPENEHAFPSYRHGFDTSIHLRDTDETTSLLSHTDVPAETINYGSNHVNDISK